MSQKCVADKYPQLELQRNGTQRPPLIPSAEVSNTKANYQQYMVNTCPLKGDGKQRSG